MSHATKVDFTVREVDIDLIRIVDGHNPRTHIDPQGIEELAADMKVHGVLEPPTVVAVDGHFEILAGERRLLAARKAKLRKMPVSIRPDGDRSGIAQAENDHTEGLDPIAIGRQCRAIAEEHNLTTRAAIAARARRSVRWVSEHLRLLDLPEGVQRHVAEGVIPIEAEPALRAVAEVSPRVAECVCELARRRKVKPSRFLASFGDLLCDAAEARFEERPTMIPVARAPLSRTVADPDQRKAILAMLADAFPGEEVSLDPEISFSEQEIDAARPTSTPTAARTRCSPTTSARAPTAWSSRCR